MTSASWTNSQPQLIRKYGYNLEKHQVLTEDGYLLALFRIPPRRGPSTKRPVLMMHSLMSSCSDFILIGPKHALGYLLADRDYDIWLGNARGNRYSRRHKRLHVKSPKFWNFTFHEIGYYDVPALIDYVLDKTNSAKLHYVGFSQGTLVSFVAMSTRPEYNAKIVQMQEISPAAYLGEPPSFFIRILSELAPSLGIGFNISGSSEFLPYWKGQYDFYNTVCPAPAQLLCRLLLNDVVGANPRQLHPVIQISPLRTTHSSLPFFPENPPHLLGTLSGRGRSSSDAALRAGLQGRHFSTVRLRR